MLAVNVYYITKYGFICLLAGPNIETTQFFFFFTLPYSVWSNIVIVHEKSVFFFFASFFRNILKNGWNILIKKIRRNHGISVYKKALVSEHRKIIFFEIITVLSKCRLVSLLVSMLRIFVDALAQKLLELKMALSN